jgi:hypothetical protein
MMSNEPNDPIQPGAGMDSLDFERAEGTAGDARACAQCATPITDSYYTLGEHVLCEPCQFQFKNATSPGNAATRLFGAAGLGALAAIVGCVIWMVVTELTGYEIGLIAIAIGFIVGMAVQVGARGQGGLVYQLLAVFLTYSAIVMTYVPMLANEIAASEEFQQEVQGSEYETEEGVAEPGTDCLEHDSEVAPVVISEADRIFAWVAAIPIAYMVPFLLGFENVIGILIIGFALWQAFRMNARQKLDLQGPFRLDARDTIG